MNVILKFQYRLIMEVVKLVSSQQKISNNLSAWKICLIIIVLEQKVFPKIGLK